MAKKRRTSQDPFRFGASVALDDDSIADAARQLTSLMFDDDERFLTEFLRWCNSCGEPVYDAVDRLLNQHKKLGSRLDDALNCSLTIWLPTTSQTKCRTAWASVAKRCSWKVSNIELFAIFGRTATSFRFLQALVDLSHLEPNFPEALRLVQSHRESRRAGMNLGNGPRGRTSADAEWQAGNAQNAVQELLGRGVVRTKPSKVTRQKNTASKTSLAKEPENVAGTGATDLGDERDAASRDGGNGTSAAQLAEASASPGNARLASEGRDSGRRDEGNAHQ